MKNTQLLFLGLVIVSTLQNAMSAPPSTLDAKKQGEQDVRQIVDPVLNQYCREQCKIIHVETEVDIAVDDAVAPGFDEQTGKAVLSAASGKLRLLMDDNLGQIKRDKILALLKDRLEELNFPVSVETKITKFPEPATSSYRLADLREKVSHDIKSALQNLLLQFCPEKCALGEFEVQSEIVNAEDVDYTSSQDFFQDGPAAIRVRGVKATVMVDQDLPAEEANGIVEMARLKIAQYKASQVTSKMMKFPKPVLKNGQEATKTIIEEKNSSTHSETSSSNSSNNSNSSNTNSKEELKGASGVRGERGEKGEKGDVIRTDNTALQESIDRFRVYGILFGAVIFGLIAVIAAMSFRRSSFRGGRSEGSGTEMNHPPVGAMTGRSQLSEEKNTLMAMRFESERLYRELVDIYSEQPKVAKHVFSRVLTEEGVETTAQYLQIFGESVVMDLLRDPALQSDLSELMDFYAVNTLEINEEEKMQLLKKLHHRTVSGKMAVHGSRSAVLFDFLVEMDVPQIVEMIKNESNTVKAIVLTQCDQKKRQALFVAHDEGTRIKLMTELSRIDHLPKNYIHNVATALRRKKAENPKLNTEALPGTDVLVSFLEKTTMDTQRTIIHQLMNHSGVDALQNLKAKLVSLETLGFMKDQQLVDVVTHVKNDELVQFLKACGPSIRDSVLSKLPQDLAGELGDQLALAESPSREAYGAVERKVINRIKVMANQGQINLAEINERMFSAEFGSDFSASEVMETDMRRTG